MWPIHKDALTLRPFTGDDSSEFARLNADPDVMRYFPNVMSRAESDLFLQRLCDYYAMHNHGLMAVEVDGVFAGFVGLSQPPYETPFTPCTEIGWRLLPAFWGKGVAIAAAKICLEVGFTRLDLSEIVSFTAQTNLPSQKLMQRLGMVCDPADDFDHPRLASDSPLLRHVLYRLTKTDWQKNR